MFSFNFTKIQCTVYIFAQQYGANMVPGTDFYEILKKIENHHSFTRCYVVKYCTYCTFGIEQITSQTSFLFIW